MNKDKLFLIRDKYRHWMVYLLAAIPIFSLLLYGAFYQISKEEVVILVLASIIPGKNLISFLYDEDYIFGGGIFPSDGSVGRLVFAFIFLLLYMFAQFLPMII